MSQYDKTTEAKAIEKHYLSQVDAFCDGRASAKESLEIAVRALENVVEQMPQPAERFRIGEIALKAIAAIKERGDYP